jgi:hypothetical protein
MNRETQSKLYLPFNRKKESKDSLSLSGNCQENSPINTIFHKILLKINFYLLIQHKLDRKIYPYLNRRPRSAHFKGSGHSMNINKFNCFQSFYDADFSVGRRKISFVGTSFEK